LGCAVSLEPEVGGGGFTGRFGRRWTSDGGQIEDGGATRPSSRRWPWVAVTGGLAYDGGGSTSREEEELHEE
jgi:hypothetical protein